MTDRMKVTGHLEVENSVYIEVVSVEKKKGRRPFAVFRVTCGDSKPETFSVQARDSVAVKLSLDIL